jgi:hypothetical protein
MITPSARRITARRKASIYVLVVVSMTIILVAGLSGLEIARATRKSQSTLVQVGAARQAALAGLEYAMGIAENTNEWRKEVIDAGGVILNSVALADTSVTVTAAAPAGSSLDDGLDVPVILTASAKALDAEQRLQCELAPASVIDPILNYAIASNASILLTNTVTRSTGTFMAKDSIQMTSAHVWADLIAGASITGSKSFRATTPNAPILDLPNTSLIDWYVARARTIGYTQMTNSNDFILGPGVNTLGGGTSPDGIYFIDLEGKNLTLSNFRLVGTLILKNASKADIAGAMVLQPGALGWPTLIVESDFAITGDSPLLSESLEKTNFNPPSMPFEGTSDHDKSDEYLSIIEGIVFIKGKLSLTGTNALRGSLITNDEIQIEGSLIANPMTFTNPPPGFVISNGFVPKSTSYKRIVQ